MKEKIGEYFYSGFSCDISIEKDDRDGAWLFFNDGKLIEGYTTEKECRQAAVEALRYWQHYDL